jgi:hypothetical protein
MNPVSLGAALAAIFAVGAWSPAQDKKKADDSMEGKLAKLLEEPFFKKAPWITDYDAARAEAKKSGKPIFVYFTRSYAF